jgi:hypothetical protein
MSPFLHIPESSTADKRSHEVHAHGFSLKITAAAWWMARNLRSLELLDRKSNLTEEKLGKQRRKFDLNLKFDREIRKFKFRQNYHFSRQ